MDKIESALLYATQAHIAQKRKHSGLPYIVHPIEVMKRVSNYGITDEEILCAAVLHDVHEDCPDFSANVLSQYGKNVYDIMLECSRDESTSKLEFLESFRHKSIASIVIKIADRFCNVHDYLNVKETKVYATKYALQANELYNIFIHRVKNQEALEDDITRNILIDIAILRQISFR